MKPPSKAWQRLEKLVLVPGHAVYVGEDSRSATSDGSWILRNYQKGEPPCYIEHVRSAVVLAAHQPASLLVFSGGQTRLEAGPRSEGHSYWTLANQFALWDNLEVQGRVTAEEFARDSFENLLFGVARFRECTGHYPRSIEIVGWEFKRARFDLHRRTIQWPEDAESYAYHGVNNPPDLAASVHGEVETMEAFTRDPFGGEDRLSKKRESRDPFHRRPPYAATCPEIAGLLEHKTATSLTFEKSLPWEKAPAARNGHCND